jgi:predicted Zn-dependent protease
VSAAIQAPLGVAVPGAIAQSVVDKVVGVGGFAGEFASRAATKVSDALVVSVVTQIKSGYSQASETEADRLAVSYMQRAGYDPRAALSVARTFSAWHEE